MNTLGCAMATGLFGSGRRRSRWHGTADKTSGSLLADEGALVSWLEDVARRRQPRPLAARIAIPLAVMMSLLVMPALFPVLAFCAWWWTPWDPHPWEWLAVVGRGVLGTLWVLVGVSLLVAYPARLL